MPVNVHLIDHPDGRVLVDTGMAELHPFVADMDPHLTRLMEQDIDLESIDIVVNSHLHFDHCVGNHPFAGKPFYVQRRELKQARAGGYTIPEWVDAVRGSVPCVCSIPSWSGPRPKTSPGGPIQPEADDGQVEGEPASADRRRLGRRGHGRTGREGRLGEARRDAPVSNVERRRARLA